MQIAVLVKQVPDTATRIRVNDTGTGIVTDGIKWVMNPYDEFAVEEALRLREKFSGEVVLVTLGPDRVEETIRQGLAMGADRAIRITGPEIEGLDYLATAKVLAAALKQETWDLVFCGKQAVDDDAAETGPLVAVELGLPQVMVVLELTVDEAAKTLRAKRELEGATETVELPYPAVVGAQRGLNTPRYPTLPNIMKAKRKEVKVLTLSDLGLTASDLEGAQRVVVQSYFMPPPRPEAKVLTGDPVESAKQLVDLLHQEAKVI